MYPLREVLHWDKPTIKDAIQATVVRSHEIRLIIQGYGKVQIEYRVFEKLDENYSRRRLRLLTSANLSFRTREKWQVVNKIHYATCVLCAHCKE